MMSRLPCIINRQVEANATRLSAEPGATLVYDADDKSWHKMELIATEGAKRR